jgi:hypothetical protein
VKHALKSSGGVVQPSQLVKNLRSFSKQFRVGRQEDAHEFMRYLVEALHKCCLPPGAAKLPPEKQSSFVYRAFAGRLRSQVGLAWTSKTTELVYDAPPRPRTLRVFKWEEGREDRSEVMELGTQMELVSKKGRGERLVNGQLNCCD